MIARVVFLAALLVISVSRLKADGAWFTAIPSSAVSGQSYYVEASASGGSDITIYKNSSWLTNSSGYSPYAGANTTDYGAQTVEYMAEGYDWNYSYYDYTYAWVTITVPNTAPTITWVVNPASMLVNQWFGIQARANDVDGNLVSINVWREWTPFAFNGGGNGYECYSDGNHYVQSTPGTVTFMAQAQDSTGAYSPIIYHAVNITNNAPTVSASSANIYVGQTASVSWTAGDPDGNFSHVNAWITRWGSPYWDDLGTGGATGSKSWASSANFNSSVPGSDTYLFLVRSVDSAGAYTDVAAPFNILNRAPTNPTIVGSGAGVTLAGDGQYYMWADTPITLTAGLHDDDGNLTTHAIYHQRVTGPSPDSGAWVIIDNDQAASNGTNSSKVKSFTPNIPGRWDFHTNGHDGYLWAGGASITVNVYGPNNGSTFVSQIVNGVSNPTSATLNSGQSFSFSVTMKNTGDKPWTSDATPHRLGAVNDVSTWGSARVGLPSSLVNPQASATFIFNATAPTMPGTYTFRWQMVEDGVQWFGPQTPAVTVTVVDTLAPSVPTLSSPAKTHNSISLSWTASTDNSGTVTGYKVYRNGGTTPIATQAGLTFTDTGLTQNTAYTYTVKAYDAAGLHSAASNTLSVTTKYDPVGDADMDGLSNGWEEQYFGSATAADPNTDPDNDGITNIAEFNLGTNPTTYNPGTGTVGGTIVPGWPNTGSTSAAVGATAGELSVDKSGALTYSVALWTTPGTAGMEPKMSLNYSSQAGNGIAGYGWSLSGVSAITRGPQTKAIDTVNRGITLSANDRFYLDGQRLILISGTYGAANSEYCTELESFTKVVAYGTRGSGPAYFKAWTKAGLIIEFGNTADAAFDAWGKTEAFNWNVNRISDTNGNYMNFVYEENAAAGEHRLTRINYTGNGSVLPYASLRFEYETRTDTFSGYSAGAPVSSLKRLKTVKSYFGETVARTYTLNYTERTTVNTRSLLSSLSEKGSDGTAYPNLVFTYETPVGGWSAQSNFTPPYPFAQKDVALGVGLMDLNADGFPDFVRKKANNSGVLYNQTYLNTPAGWASSTSYQLPGVLSLAWQDRADAGARFADLDGDGLVDILFSYKNSNGTITNYASRNTGSGWADYSAALIPSTSTTYAAGTVYIAEHNQSDTGRRLLDVNGDGLPDLVWNSSNSGSIKGCLINNSDGKFQLGGTFWVRADQWAPPFALVESISSGGQFMDVNGDGLPDLVRHGLAQSGIEIAVAINTPTGWVWEQHNAIIPNSTAYSTYKSYLPTLGKYLPPTILNKDGQLWNAEPLGTEVVDLNGDGLSDVIMSNPKANSAFGTPRAYLNTGDGWILSSNYAPPAGVAMRGRTSGTEVDATGAALIDLNGDGLVDLAVNQVGQSPVYYLNTGRGWGAINTSYLGAVSLQLPYAVAKSDPLDPTGTQFADLNGDGVADIISNTGAAYFNLAKATADRLITVTNGMGVAASITYKPLTDSSIYTKGSGGPAGSANVVGPMYVVSTVSNDDGVGGQYAVNYKFGGLRSSLLRGSLGFAYMEVTDSRTAIQSQTTSAQEYPFIGMPIESKTVAGSIVLKLSQVVYATKDYNAAKTKFVFAQDSDEESKDLNGVPTGSVSTTIAVGDIDDYGNIKKIVVDTDGFTKTTDSVYTNNASTWQLGRLSSATVTSAAPVGYGLPPVIRNSSFTYHPTTGLLATETVEPGAAALALTTTYGYDAFGNKTSVVVSGASISVDTSGVVTTGAAVSRTTTTQYDANGRFPLWTENALGHRENYTLYNQELGVLTQMTGANALTTNWGYDSFGRKVYEGRADGTVSTSTYRWVVGAPPNVQYAATAPTAKYHVESNSTGAPPTLSFHDAFGRAFVSLGANGDGKIVYQTTQYDGQGRAYASSTPYFAGGTAHWAATTSYDLLNRPKITVTPDDEAPGGQVTTTYDYNGLQAIATDPKGRVARTVKNAQGWTTHNIRNETASGGATASTVIYGYDAIGNLISTNADATITTLAYDLRGRKTSMVDADMGNWQYRYNIFGELIWQKDAKGQIVTMAYDTLGRLTSRVETEGTTAWTYDSAAAGGAWKGKLYQVAAPGSYGETYAYDAYGRPTSVTRTIDSVAYATSTAYDSIGRPIKTVYPATGIGSGPVATRNVYNSYGYLKEIRNYLASDDGKPNHQLQGLLYWQADSYGVRGVVEGETYGNGLSNDRWYSEVTGRLRRATVDRGKVVTAPFYVQDLNYTYDAMGNVKSRIEAASGFARSEYFSDAGGGDGYDGLDRLKVHRIVGGATVTVNYLANGNISYKSDVGNYTYVGYGPHAVNSTGVKTYTYDLDGNMLTGAGRTFIWTSFNQMKKVTDTASTKSSEFFFGAGHERIKQVRKTGTAVTDTTLYIGGLYEKVTTATGNVVEHKHYIMAPSGRIAVVTQSTANGVVQANNTRYFHTDGLGSITAVSDEKGQVLKRYAYDAWGKQSTLYTNTGSGITNQAPSTRGFTDHEMLNDFGLIHMNGRIYDPTLGRFLSADMLVDDAADAQGFNRYTYVGNNPLSFTDPTGHLKFWKEFLGPIVQFVATVYFGPLGGAVVGATIDGWKGAAIGFAGGLGMGIGNFVGGTAAWGNVGYGFATGFSGSLLNGGSIGDAFKSGVIGGAQAYFAGKIGDHFGHDIGDFWNETGRAVAHGALGGAIEEARGGEFRHGFYAGFAGSAAGSIAGSGSLGEMKGIEGLALRTTIAAVIGGTAAELGGGKFANGAQTAAFQHLFNHEGGFIETFQGYALGFAEGFSGLSAGDGSTGSVNGDTGRSLGIGIGRAVQFLNLAKGAIAGARYLGSKLSVNGATAVASGAGFTSSSVSIGQRMHQAYRASDTLAGVRIKEYVLKGVGRIDFIDLEKRIIYELKPNNPRAIQQGIRQLQTYKAEVERIFGPGFKTVLETY